MKQKKIVIFTCSVFEDFKLDVIFLAEANDDVHVIIDWLIHFQYCNKYSNTMQDINKMVNKF